MDRDWVSHFETQIFIIFFLLFISLDVAYGQGRITRCANRVEELAQLHVLMDQNPGLGLRDLIDTDTVGGAVGALTMAYLTRPRVPGEEHNRARQWNLERRRGSLRRQILSTYRGAGAGVANMNGPFFLNQFEIRSTQGPWGLSPRPQNLVIEEAIQRMERMAEGSGRTFSAAEKLRLRTLLPEYFQLSHQINETQSTRSRAFSNRNNRIRHNFRRTQITAGGVLGFMMGQQINAVASHLACDAYGVGPLVGMFRTSVVQLASEENPCYLSQQGAQEILADPYRAGNLCERYPNLPAAMENSLNLYANRMGHNGRGKTELATSKSLQCMTDGAHLSVEVAGVPLRMHFNDVRTQIDFTMTGSQAGPNRGKVLFARDGTTTFENTWGARLSRQTENSTDLSALSHYYINTPGLPTLFPTLSRRYLMGAGVVLANMYRQTYLRECQNHPFAQDNSEFNTHP